MACCVVPSRKGREASMLALRSALCAVALVPAAALASEGSLRCDGGLVSVGDSKLDLVGKCGWPTLREDELGERTVVLLERRGPYAFNRSVTARVERWTYDFGTNRFIQIVVLEGGRIVRIERGGYGYGVAPAAARPPVPRALCADPAFHEGDTAYEVLSRCGEPAFRELRVDVRTQVVGGEHAPVVAVDSTTVAVEVWAYDFGPRAFVRHLTFEDGRLVRVETGSYGYAR
jgi:uncharacterized protein DUF2845